MIQRTLGAAVAAGWLLACGPQEAENEPLGVTEQAAQLGAGAISAQERARREEMIRAYAREVVARRNPVATTVTPSGQVIDWVPAPIHDEDWKNPPKPPPGIADDGGSMKTELQADPSLMGPDDTVPYVRFDVERYLKSVDVPPATVAEMRPVPTPEGNPTTCLTGTESSCNRYYTKRTYQGDTARL